MWTAAQAITRFKSALPDTPKDPIIGHEEYDASVKIGDSISLFSIEGSGYLSSNGFTNKDCKITKANRSGAPPHFSDCVFKIHPRYKYDSQKALNDQLSRLGRDRSTINKEEVDLEIAALPNNNEEEELVQTLLANEESEKNENFAEFQRMAGKNVQYGQAVQLIHGKSGKFLTVTVKEFAELEKDCLRVILDADGNEGSWFVITPRFKMRSEGEPVQMGDQIVLESKKYNVFLHLTTDYSEELKMQRTEVNASSDASGWRVVPYGAYIPDESNFLKAGDVIRLFHKEAEGFITNEKIERFENEEPAAATLAPQSPTLRVLNNSRINKSQTDNQNQNAEQVFLEPSMPGDMPTSTNSNSVWLVESANTMRGGVARFSRLYRFKHIATGKYLAGSASESNKKPAPTTETHSLPRAVSLSNLLGNGTEDEQVNIDLITVDDCNSPAALFSVHVLNISPQENDDAMIGIDNCIRLRHHQTQCWVHAESMPELGILLPSPSMDADSPALTESNINVEETTLNRSASKPFRRLHSFRFAQSPNERIKLNGSSKYHDGDVFSFARVPKHEVDSIYQVNGQIAFLTSFVTKLKESFGDKSLVDELRGEKARQVGRVLHSLVHQICKSDHHFEWSAAQVPSAGGDVAIKKDNVADRSMQNLLREQRIIDVLIQLLKYTFDQGGLSLSEISKPENYTPMTICRHSYELLRLILKDNPQNRRYMTKYAKIVQGHCGYSIKSTSTLRELYKDNNLLLKKLNDQQIDFFIQKLNEKGRVGRYIKFLSIFCSCNGKSLPNNQLLVCKSVVSENAKLLMPMQVQDEKLMIKKDNESHWTSITQFAQTANDKEMKYLTLTVKLLSDLCLGGNSTTSGMVCKFVTPRMALLGLQDYSLPPSLRTAFATLILNLHRSSTGQAKPINYINYTRLWTDVQQELAPSSSGTTVNRSLLDRKMVSVSALIVVDVHSLKVFIMEYLQRNSLLLTSNTDANELTCSVLILAKHLLSLGYFEKEEIPELIPLLMKIMNTVKDEQHPIIIDPYKASDFTEAIMDAKLNVCYMLEMICDYRLDRRITETLELFKRKMEDKAALEIEAKEKDKIGRVFRLFEFQPRDYVPLLLDLIRYDNEELSTSAANLLIRHYSQQQELLKALQNVQILVNEKLVHTFQSVRKHLTFLRRIITSSGINKQTGAVTDALKQLTDLCVTKKDQNVVNNRDHQRILRNLNTHETVLELMKIKLPSDVKASVVSACLELMQMFCKNNSENQTVLLDHVNFFLDFLDTPSLTVQVAQTVTEVFYENKAICSQITENQIRKFLNQMAKRKHRAYLDFLFVITEVNGRPLRRNQNLLASLLVEKQNDVLILYNDPDSIQRRNQQIREEAYLDPDSELNFHIRLVELFKRCCEGKVYEAEVKSQSLFTLDMIAAQIADESNWAEVKGVFLELLIEVYLETERSLKDIDQAHQIWDLFGIIAQQIHDFVDSPFNEEDEENDSDKKSSDDEGSKKSDNSEDSDGSESSADNVNKREKYRYEKERVYIFTHALNFIRKYFVKYYSPKKTKEKRVKTANKLIDTLYVLSKKTKNLKVEEQIAIGTCIEEMCKKNLTGVKSAPLVGELISKCKSAQETEKLSAKSTKDDLMGSHLRFNREEDQVLAGLKVFRKSCADNFDLTAELTELANLFREHAVKDEGSFTKRLIEIIGNPRVIESLNYQELLITSLQAFRLPLDDEIAKEPNSDPAVLEKMQIDIGAVGLTNLIFELIACRNDTIVYETLMLGIALLHGGNKSIQDDIYIYFKSSSKAGNFFLEIRNRMRKGIDEVDEKRQFLAKKLEKKILTRDSVASLLPSPSFNLYGDSENTPRTLNDQDLKTVNEIEDDEVFHETGFIAEILRFLQLLCEGHNLLLQNHLRLQANNLQSYDLISETAACLESLESCIDAVNADIGVQLFRTLTEYCQGPCPDNQLALIRTKLCESINYIFKHHNFKCEGSKASFLKNCMITTLLSLLEGNTSPSIPRHMLYTLNFNLIEKDLLDIIARESGGQLEEKEAEDLLELGFLEFFLLKTLADYDTEKKVQPILDHLPAENVFAQGTGRVEIVRNDKLERVYFRILPVSHYLTPKSKKELVIKVKRDTQQDKIQDFFDRSEDLIQEMEHREAIAQKQMFSFLTKQETLLLNISFFTAVLANFLIVATYDSSYVYGEMTFNSWALPVLYLLGLAQIILSSTALFIYTISYAPLAVRKKWKDIGVSYNDTTKSTLFIGTNWKNTAWSLYFLLTDSLFVYRVIYVVFAVLGVWHMPHGPYFFAFHLLDIVVRNELLKGVIKSVTLNGKSIILTTLLAMLVVYIYSIFGFLFFRSAFERDGELICDSMFMCLLTVINYGLRSGGGIGDIMKPPEWNDSDFKYRVFYDSSFFFLVIIILLNIIFGIIIDTFGELRSQNKSVEEDIHNKCFMCGIERDTFERRANGFENHVKLDHNMWHYLYFNMYLRRKERTEYTGPEQYVADKILQRDWIFVPTLKAMCLDMNEEESDRTTQIVESVDSLSKQTKSQLDKITKSLATKHKILEKKIEDIDNKSNQAQISNTKTINTVVKKMDVLDKKIENFESKIDLLVKLLSHDGERQ